MLVCLLNGVPHHFKDIVETAILHRRHTFLSERNVQRQHAAFRKMPPVQIYGDARVCAGNTAHRVRQPFVPKRNADRGRGFDRAPGERRQSGRGRSLVALAHVKHKLDAAAAAVQVHRRKVCVAVANMTPDDEHVLAEILLAKTPNDDQRADGSDVARGIVCVVHF